VTTPVTVATVSLNGLTAAVPQTTLYVPDSDGTFQVNASLLTTDLRSNDGVLPVLSIGYNDGTAAQVCNPLADNIRMGGDGRIIGVQQITCAGSVPITYGTTLLGVTWPTYNLSFTLAQLVE
jgi:hypothetical protein